MDASPAHSTMVDLGEGSPDAASVLSGPEFGPGVAIDSYPRPIDQASVRNTRISSTVQASSLGTSLPTCPSELISPLNLTDGPPKPPTPPLPRLSVPRPRRLPPPLPARPVLWLSAFCCAMQLPLIVASLSSDTHVRDPHFELEASSDGGRTAGLVVCLLAAVYWGVSGGAIHYGVSPSLMAYTGAWFSIASLLVGAMCFSTTTSLQVSALAHFFLLLALEGFNVKHVLSVTQRYTATVHLCLTCAAMVVGSVVSFHRLLLPAWVGMAEMALLCVGLSAWRISVTERSPRHTQSRSPRVEPVVRRRHSAKSSLELTSHNRRKSDFEPEPQDNMDVQSATTNSSATATTPTTVATSGNLAWATGLQDSAFNSTLQTSDHQGPLSRRSTPNDPANLVNPLSPHARDRESSTSHATTLSDGTFPRSVSQSGLTTSDNSAPYGLAVQGAAMQLQNALTKGNSATQALTTRRQRNPKAYEQKTKMEWRKGDLIGQGGYGVVHIGLNEATGQLMAVKTIPFDPKDPTIKSKIELLSNEISVMKQLTHSNIVSYFFADRVGDAMHIFMEYVPGGSLRQVLDQFGPLGDAVASAYTEQILIGVAYLHSQNVIHRDIKCANVLLTTDGLCKLGDFGSSCYLDKIMQKDNPDVGESVKKKGMQGTPVWMAPEVLKEEGHDWRCDIWSLGCSVMEMLTARPPFSHYEEPPLRILHLVVTQPLCYPTGLSAGSTAFLQSCLIHKPDMRPTALDLVQHQWIRADESPRWAAADPQFDNVSCVTAATRLSSASQVSMASTRYIDTLKGITAGLVKGASDKDTESLRARRVQAVRMDIGHRVSLLGAPSVKASAKRPSGRAQTDHDSVDDPTLKFVLGDTDTYDSDEYDGEGRDSPNFRKLGAI